RAGLRPDDGPRPVGVGEQGRESAAVLVQRGRGAAVPPVVQVHAHQRPQHPGVERVGRGGQEAVEVHGRRGTPLVGGLERLDEVVQLGGGGGRVHGLRILLVGGVPRGGSSGERGGRGPPYTSSS